MWRQGPAELHIVLAGSAKPQADTNDWPRCLSSQQGNKCTVLGHKSTSYSRRARLVGQKNTQGWRMGKVLFKRAQWEFDWGRRWVLEYTLQNICIIEWYMQMWQSKQHMTAWLTLTPWEWRSVHLLWRVLLHMCILQWYPPPPPPAGQQRDWGNITRFRFFFYSCSFGIIYIAGCKKLS